MSTETLKISLVQRILNIENKKLLQKINVLLDKESMIDEKLKTSYEKDIWFKVGLKLATGELQPVYQILFRGDEVEENGRYRFSRINYNQTAKKNFPEYNTKSGNSARPYIYETIKGGDKDIYNSDDKLNKIYNYCKEKQIHICIEFEEILKRKLIIK